MFLRPKIVSNCGAFIWCSITPQFYSNFLELISLVMDSSISGVEF